MPLIRFDAGSLRFGAQPILREAEFSIEAGERVCLVGRNGAGKTSLLKLITGEIEPDSGEVNIPSTIGVSQLAQVLPRELDQKVGEFVADGLRSIQALCREYRERAQQTLDSAGLRELQLLQDQNETHGGWNVEQQVHTVCSELGAMGMAVWVDGDDLIVEGGRPRGGAVSEGRGLLSTAPLTATSRPEFCGASSPRRASTRNTLRHRTQPRQHEPNHTRSV